MASGSGDGGAAWDMNLDVFITQNLQRIRDGLSSRTHKELQQRAQDVLGG